MPESNRTHKTAEWISESKFRALFLWLVLSLVPYTFFGQTLQDFKEIWIRESREFLLSNQKPLPYLESGFHYFSGSQDESFAGQLVNAWDKYPVSPPIFLPKPRKFETPPQFHNPQMLPFYAREENGSSPDKTLHLPRWRKPGLETSALQQLNFKFYGNNLRVTIDRLLTLPASTPISPEGASEYWRKFCVANSQHLIRQLMVLRTRLGLNDWGYYKLVRILSETLYPSNQSGSLLLSWGLMIRSGFDVRIAYNQLGAGLLFPCHDRIYGMPFVTINGANYYCDKSIASFPVFTYPVAHPGANGTIRLSFSQSLRFDGELQNKKMTFEWKKKSLEFNLRFNPEIVRFYEEYPDTDPNILCTAPMTFSTEESLLRPLRKTLSGMNAEEATAFLQQFVQKSFAYHPFNDLFGYDRFIFPEELLAKDECNDKGKSLLFGWMVSHLLHAKTVLVEYPGFFSVAVSPQQPLEGDGFKMEEGIYTFVDPTFENAPMGLVMKEFIHQKPLLTKLENSAIEEAENNRIWKLATSFGAERSGSGHDILQDEAGNFYLTGFIREKRFDGTLVPAPFVAKFDKGKSLAWVERLKCTGKAFGLELTQLDQGEIYLSGSFRGDLQINGASLHTEMSDPDIFLAQLTRSGQINWLSKAGLDELEEDAGLFYVIRFTRSGQIQRVELMNEDERVGESGFLGLDQEGLCYIGSRYQSLGMDKSPTLTPSGNTLFQKYLKKFSQLGVDPEMAALTAALNALALPGSRLSGSELVSAKGKNGEELLPMQHIKWMKNVDGIVEVNTLDGTPQPFNRLLFGNNCRIKVIPFENNDLKLIVNEGVWFDTGWGKEKVKSAILELSTGNLLVVLGEEHTLVSSK
ncbi:MAG: hypothetical protein LWW85_00230 [Marinilabiliales bacterium]|nr:hypothetical protein [Marinilabiliales bacterium]